jgi:hypothetical protein
LCPRSYYSRSTRLFFQLLFSTLLWLSTVFLFFGVEMQVEKPCPLVSSCFLMFLQLGKSLPSSNLAVATGGTRGKYTKPKKLGCQVRTWHLARTWHELGSDQISRKW